MSWYFLESMMPSKPKPTVRLEPQNFIFTGDTVTLTCDLDQSTGWTFIWYRNDQEVNPQISADKTNKLSEKLSNAGTTKYKCRAQRLNYYNNNKYNYDSDYSDQVTVTVKERPKAAVIINPDNHVFVGEVVTLTCNIVNGGGVQNWRYSWNKGGSDQTVSNDQQYRISDVTENHAGKYTCTGTETGGSRSSHPSDVVLLTVSAKPKPTVRLEPQNFIYTGDTVTLTCDLNQSTGWTFFWYKNDQEVNRQISADKITTNKLERLKITVAIYLDNHVFIGDSVNLTCNIENGGGVQYWRYSWNKEGSDQTVSNDQQYRISDVTENHAGKYTCTGTETGGSRSSHPSDAVLLTVSERPKPTVIINPDNHVFIDEIVTLTCNIENGGGVQNWRYSWNKEGSDQTVSNDQQYRISDVTENHAGKYTCTGTETGGSRSSHPSSVLLTVSERPKPTVIIYPGNHVFRGEIVTLTCNIENGGRVQNWRYSWNKEGSEQTVSNKQKYKINSVIVADAGKYTCTGTETGGSRSSHPSDAVLLTVSERPKPTVTINPDNHVFVGEIVTLTCNIENGGGVQYWRYSWNKEGSAQTVSNGQQYRISDVTENHAGKYTCTGTETVGSRSSHPSDAVLLTVSAKPKPTVRLEPQNFIYTGDTVTLTCDLWSTGWTFTWYRNNWEVNPQISADKTNKLSEKLYYTGTTKYKCRAQRLNYYYSYFNYKYYDSEFSDPVTVTVEGLPKPTVTTNPDNHVFIGETVTLTCNIENGGGVQNWRYSWNKEGSDQTVSNDQQYIISDVTENHAGKYTCTGRETGGSRSSHPSDVVLLTVSEKLKPELTSNHKVAALAGNLVLLYCEVNPTAGWNFYWYKHTQNTETETTTHPSYTIYSVSVSDGGQYWCRAGRGNPVYYTHYSNALWVNVTGESSSVSLIISPSRTQHFTDESLSLSCVDQSKSTEWRVRRYTDHQGVLDCSSVSGSARESTCNISSLSTSHTGVYWCESESGGSNPVNITVHDGDVILESPVHPLTEGESLTLHCLHHKTKPSNLRADFYKDGSVVQNQTSGEMMIHQVSKSDEGFYHCKYPEGGDSPKSWVIIRGDTDTTIIGVAVGLSSALLLLVLIILLCRYKRNKDDSAAVNSSSAAHDQNDTAPEPSDVTYAAIDLKTKKKQKKNKDAVRGAKDVLYSDINLKDLKTPIKGKTSVVADTVYSELKQNTDKAGFTISGDSSEATDSTYAQVNKKSKQGKTAE
ncbi:hemicentin-1-like [Trichomycterus rosablanca]|uniref:hemicentin-1-like n=1 Tax=Trichomycterus rosablanca TaxID=2290929 RepID=UPI002F35D300